MMMSIVDIENETEVLLKYLKEERDSGIENVRIEEFILERVGHIPVEMLNLLEMCGFVKLDKNTMKISITTYGLRWLELPTK